MSKILVILTGGTIGSCLQESVISAKAERSAEIVKYYEEAYGKQNEFVVVQALNELSENLQPHNWEAITKELDIALKQDYEGVIITHGSDTLVYASAFIALKYAYTSIPILFVAANYPLDNPKSNGMHNFAGAVSFIREKAAAGVFTIYENMHSEVDVFLPTRMLNSDPYFDQYRSFDRQVFGWIKDEKFVNNTNCPVSLEMVNNRNRHLTEQLSFLYENEILYIPMYLGINFDHYKCTAQTKAVVLSLYHSATAPSNEKAGLVRFIRECKEAGIAVYGTSFKGKDISFYETTFELVQEGLKPMFNISSVAAYVKLVLAYNQSQVPVDVLLESNLFFEELENLKSLEKI